MTKAFFDEDESYEEYLKAEAEVSKEQSKMPSFWETLKILFKALLK